VIQDIQASGIVTLGGIARELGRRGVPTPGGAASWQAVRVRRMMQMAG
jgi:hypothetical protein